MLVIEHAFLQCACNSRAEVRLIRSNASGEPKIRNFRHEILVEEDVARFYVPVDDLHSAVSVKIRKALGCSCDDAQPLLPSQDMGRIVDCSRRFYSLIGAASYFRKNSRNGVWLT